MSEKEYDVVAERALETIKRLLEEGYDYICDYQDGPYTLKILRRRVGVREGRLHRELGVARGKTR